MDVKFIQERISDLRIKKGISEYKMSLDLGHNKSYIQGISSGKALPSLSELLYICEYLGVTPKEFFDEDIEAPEQVNKLYSLTQKMNSDDIEILINMAERMSNK